MRKKEELIGIFVLTFVTAFAGFMGVNKRFNDSINNSIETKTKEYSGNNKNHNNYYYDDEDYNYDDQDNYHYYENDNIYTGNYSYDYYNEYNDQYYYNGDDSYKYEGYKDYTGNYNYNSSIYKDKEAPSIKYSRSDIIYQYSSYDPWANVSASHSKFGDVTGYIEITYNNLDVNVPGNYSIVYKACNYPGSSYCRTVTKTVKVKEKTDSNINNNINFNNYSKAPVWSNTSDKICTQGNTSCSTYNITKPTAKDPYTNRNLNVSLISGSVDIYTPGTYVLIYHATTNHNISGTITKKVVINKTTSYNDNNYNYNDNYYNQSKKYIYNNSSAYYDDGQYRGYLNANNNGERTSKYISNYKWTNKVSYTYRCDNKNGYGTNGWTYISTNTSDDHPTYSYNNGGFTGTLSKVDAYCVPGSGCVEDLNRNLGTCSNVGQYKTVYRTWIGLYSGYVYANQKQTYSGYVYLYR